MSAHRQIQRRRRGIFVDNAAQAISSSVGAAYFDFAPDGAENDFISILQVYRADGAAEERTTSASVATAEESSVVQLTPIAAGTGKPASISARKSLAKRTRKKTGSCARSSFDAVVANPPFSYRWEPKEDMSDDVRFKNYGLAPKSAADFAFLLHGFHFLKDQGVMAIILPHGVLFRGGKEEEIRTKLLKDGHIDTVIGLPPNLFYSTGIPVCILVLKKCKKPDDVLFINAAEHFDKGKRQNVLLEEHINKIVETYKQRPKSIERYARRVEMAEIEKEGFNLDISRYISTAVNEAEIDLKANHDKLIEIEDAIQKATNKHNVFLMELRLPPLP